MNQRATSLKELIEYDGDLRVYPSIWIQFNPIHYDEGLSVEDEVKFQFLKQATAIDPYARRVVSIRDVDQLEKRISVEENVEKVRCLKWI